uniref:Uncharacterized protein n=1 Tax=Plectus sambesii TaxID=2011161 RepID=A0A914V3Z8_9BILA
MDIRKFFGGGGSSSSGSALSVEKQLAGSPVRPKPREPSMNKRKKAFLSSDDDD